MRSITVLGLIFGLFHFSVSGQFYQPVFPTLSGNDLLENVLISYKPATVLDYGEARDFMYAELDKQGDSVRCVYSGHALYLPVGVDPSAHLYMNGAANGINTEHSYPRSKGADEDDGNGKGFSDLHHLFPTRAAVNSARGNFPFAEIPDDQATSWYYRDEIGYYRTKVKFVS